MKDLQRVKVFQISTDLEFDCLWDFWLIEDSDQEYTLGTTRSSFFTVLGRNTCRIETIEIRSLDKELFRYEEIL